MIQNIVVKLAGQRASVDKLLRIDACGRTACDVANIVGAGAA
jgi:hypothetical protein